jgi:serine/threonine protein kinase
MKMTKSRFIVGMHAAYTTPQVTYLLLEPALGGELFTVFHKESLFGKKAHAKYYSAGVALALEHLHSRRIVCRDLKMENVLLDERGHVKLCDMGYAKFVLGKTYSTVGTPEYFAPEMVRGSGHNVALDWWTFGVFIYELLAGISPFAGSDPVSVARNVLSGVEHVYFPPPCQGVAEELLKRLLVTEPNLRLPMRRPAGLQSLKQHAWYTGLDWDALGHGELRPPFEPVVEDNRDTHNFITSEEDKPQPLEYTPSGDDETEDSDLEFDALEGCQRAGL